MYATLHSVSDDAYEGSRSFKASIRILTCSVWLGAISFGCFALFHYVLSKHATAWEQTDPGLYREKNFIANTLMLLHLIGGSFLMFAGPIQLIPSFRQKFLNVHRWIGRGYIASVLLASGCVTIFVVCYRTSRKDIHEDIGNFIFGVAAFVCAAQSYRHAAFSKKVDCHKRWSWRLYAVILGALLYRLYAAVYFGLVFFTPWQGNDFLYESLYYTLAIPNLIVVELIWKRDGKPLHSSLLIVCIAFILSTSTLITLLAWLPAILGLPTRQAEALKTPP